MKKRHLIALFMILLLLIPALSGCGKDLTTKISLESGEYYWRAGNHPFKCRNRNDLLHPGRL